MQWISALQLEEWARSIPSETDLPRVVADLILASAAEISDIRFPAGDKGRARGFDGVLDCGEGGLFVPSERSIWEFGTSENYRTKALGDFRKRTTEVAASEQREITLVLVTPWTWDNPNEKLEDWVSARRAESSWKDIRVIDGARLEAWLNSSPAVAARHARSTFGRGQTDGLRSTDEFWADFSGQFNPALAEEVLLCERAELAQEVLDDLLKTPTVLSLVADSPDEVIAFVIAAIRKAPEEVRAFLEMRTLVVDSLAAARRLTHDEHLILLLRGDATKSPMQFAGQFSLLVALGRQSRNDAAKLLPRPTSYEMGKALTAMGFDEAKAQTLARGSGRSLAALARLIPGGERTRPSWEPQSSDLLPTLLAGSWDMLNAHDKAALETIAGGTSYAELERRARALLRDPDPPFELQGSMWKVRAPMDAFMHLGPLLGEQEAGRLKAAMIEVFGQIEPDPDPDEPVIKSRRDPDRHSEWLREGLAVTLLLIAVWSAPAEVNLGRQSGEAFAEEVLESLPGLTSDYRLLASLESELPLLAEAAPRPLLSALEHMLEGNGELIRPIFREHPGLLGPNYRHAGLLWALETLAWGPEHFRRAVLILARLAEIDPGIKLGNRPISSLAEIFVLWAPNTNASSSQRLAVLEEIAELTPDVGWRLTLRLLPSLHGSSSPTAKPRLREAGATDRQPVTYRELWADQRTVVALAIRLADQDGDRWRQLVPHLYLFPPEEREAALVKLRELLSVSSRDQGSALWSALRDEVARHQRFAKAKWSLSPEELAPMKAVVDEFAPDDPLATVRVLFDNWDMDGSGDAGRSKPERRRAIEELLSSGGAESVVELGLTSKLPFLVLEALEAAQPSAETVGRLLEGSFARAPLSLFTLGLMNLYRRSAGEAAAKSWIEAAISSGSATTSIAAQLLIAWPDNASTWTVVRRFGRDIETSYWEQRPARFVASESRTDLARMTLLLLRHGRAVEAIQSVSTQFSAIPTRLLFRLLDGIGPQLNASEAPADTMTVFYAEQILQELDKRDDTSLDEIAKREYQLFPLFEFGSRKLRIDEVLAANPQFYFSLIESCFRADGDESEPTTEERNRAKRAYSILAHFELLPGSSDEGPDEARLGAWIAEVRRLGAEHRRSHVTDNYAGKVLAHAPADPEDHAWPHSAVRRILENLKADGVERGIAIERFNMRGAHSRGILEGGGQERGLAEQYRNWAKATEAFPRTSALLKIIAKDWEAHAEQMDIWAAQRRLQS